MTPSMVAGRMRGFMVIRKLLGSAVYNLVVFFINRLLQFQLVIPGIEDHFLHVWSACGEDILPNHRKMSGSSEGRASLRFLFRAGEKPRFLFSHRVCFFIHSDIVSRYSFAGKFSGLG